MNETGRHMDTKVYFYDRKGRRHDLTEVGIEEVEIQPITVNGHMAVKLCFMDPRLRISTENINSFINLHEEDFRMVGGIPEND